jgi:hypothetical protein
MLETIRGGGGKATFLQEDILSPEGLVLALSSDPLLYDSEITDWTGLVNAMGDSADPIARMLISGLSREQREMLSAIKKSEPLDDQMQDSLLETFNQLINRHRVYNQEGFIFLQLPASALEICTKYRLVADGRDLIPSDIKDPVALYTKLSVSSDSLSRILYSVFPAPAKLQLKKKKVQQYPDSMRVILAAGLNLALGSLQLAGFRPDYKGSDTRVGNQALMLSAYKGLLDIRTGEPSSDENKRLNRVLLETAARGSIRSETARFKSNPLVPALKDRLAAQLEQILLQYNGETAMADAEKRILLDGLNEAAAGADLQPALATDSLAPEQSVKTLVDGLSGGDMTLINAVIITHYLPGFISPDRVVLNPMLRLRSLAGAQFNARLAQQSPGQPLDGQGRQEILEGINAALASRIFYQEINWRGRVLTPEIRDLLAEGVNGLSDADLKRLNRLLLETLIGSEIERLGSEKKYTTLMHSPWLSEIWADVGDMYYEYIAYAQPVMDWGVFGFNVIFISEGTSERTSVTGENQGQFSSFEFSPCLSYGNEIFEGLLGGVNLKLIHSHLAPFGAEGSQGKGVATSWALDFGALYKGPFPGLSLGANLQNIGPKLTYIDAEEADPLSRNIRAGMAYNLLDGRLAKMTMAYDLTKMLVVTDRPWKEELKEAVHHMGVEYLYTGLATLGLRSGYVIDEVGQIKGPTFGLGVGYKNIQFDFGMEPGGELQKYNKKYSLSVEL